MELNAQALATAEDILRLTRLTYGKYLHKNSKEIKR